MKNAVMLTLLCVLTMSAAAGAADAPKLVGEKEIMKLDGNIAYRQNRAGGSMRLSPDGRRMLYFRGKVYKSTRARVGLRGYKLHLRDLKTGKDTPVPVPALLRIYLETEWLSMTVFDPTGKTLIVPVGQDANKNDILESTERCKAGLYDIASGKLKTLDIEADTTFPTFHPDGKTLVVLTLEGDQGPRDIKVLITPTDKIKFRGLSSAGMIRSISPTSDLMAILLLTEGERPQPGKFVLYDLKTDTIKAELAGQDQSRGIMEHNPQWTADGRYIYHLIVKNERRGGRSHSQTLTRIWDAKTGKEAGILSGVIPVGPGPGKGTMVLIRHQTRTVSLRTAKPLVVLHAQDDKTLGGKLTPLGDKFIRPITTQGKWLLFIRYDPAGSGTVCMAEIALPKK